MSDKVWAVMRKVNVRGQGLCINLFDSEDKAKRFVEDEVDLSRKMESNPYTRLTHQHFSIIQMEVR